MLFIHNRYIPFCTVRTLFRCVEVMVFRKLYIDLYMLQFAAMQGMILVLMVDEKPIYLTQ